MNQVSKNRWHTLSHRRLQSHPTALSSNGTLLLNSGTSKNASSLPAFLQLPLTKILNHLHDGSDEPHSGTSNIPLIPSFFTTTNHKTPNHVLINEYPPGIGIAPHEDGPAYAPVVATVSLGDAVVLDVCPKDSNENENEKGEEGDDKKDGGVYDGAEKGQRRKGGHSRILLEPRSLFVTTGDAYKSCLHGIQDVQIDEELGLDTIANWSLTARGTKNQNGNSKEASGRTDRNIRTATRVSLTYRDVLKVKDVGKMVFGKGTGLGSGKR